MDIVLLLQHKDADVNAVGDDDGRSPFEQAAHSMSRTVTDQDPDFDEAFDFVRWLSYTRPAILPATIRRYVADARLFIEKTSCDAPLTETPLCSAWFKRAAALPRERHFKEAAPKQLLERVITDETLSLGLRAALLLQWFKGLRIGEILPKLVGRFDPAFDILRRDLSFNDDGDVIQVLIKHRKGDKTNSGGFKYLHPDHDDVVLCPVAFFRRFLNSTECFDPALPLFRHASGKNCTPAQMAKALKSHADAMGLDPRLYSCHSVRSGAATELASQQFPMEDLLIFGDWASISGSLRYLRATQERDLRTAHALRLSSDSCGPSRSANAVNILAGSASHGATGDARGVFAKVVSAAAVDLARQLQVQQQLALPWRLGDARHDPLAIFQAGIDGGAHTVNAVQVTGVASGNWTVAHNNLLPSRPRLRQGP